MATTKNDQVFDVSKPGKAAASPTSRPIIVGHGPMLKDPMMNDKTGANNTDASAEPEANDKDTKSQSETEVPSETRKVIQPPTISKTLDNAKTEADDNTSATKENSSQDQKSDDNSQSASDTSSSEEAAIDTVANQSANKKQESKEAKARIEAANQLIKEQKYFLPIHGGSAKVGRWILMVILLLVILLAAVYLMIDAEVIDLGVDLPYQLIN